MGPREIVHAPGQFELAAIWGGDGEVVTPRQSGVTGASVSSPAGTTTSAVSECDLFLMLTIQLSLRKPVQG
jgi:hypothetical protein